ncbi:MAG: hypothetical protein HY077_13275 [Elusimicrobia bacterium]|nr:hypothetical protein [Elusimicrobiota bacterium]
MRKVEIVAGSCIALLAIVSIGQLYLDRQPDPQKGKPSVKDSVKSGSQEQTQTETKAVTIDEVVETYLPSLKEGTEVGKQVALGSLIDELEGPEFGRTELMKDAGEALSQAAIAIIESPDAEAKAPEELKVRVAGFLAGRTHGPSSRDYALKILDEGTTESRQAVLRGLGAQHGVGGKKVFDKVSELGSKGLISGEALPGLLRRTGGSRAIEPITAVMKSTDSPKVISACVIALQDTGEPSVLGPAFERLEAVGMIDKPKALPWISSAMFGKFMETAEGSTLSRGIKAMRTRPSLVKAAVSSLEKGLSKGDPDTRRNAADAIKKAVVGKFIDAKRGEELLAGRLSVETEPVLKAELTGGLEQVRGMTAEPKAPETKQQ